LLAKVFVIAIALIPCAAYDARAGQQFEAAVVVGAGDAAYVQELALEGLAGLDLGYEALQRSTRDDVREFALDSVNLHAPALKQLQRFAAEHKLAFPESLESHPEFAAERPWEDGIVSFDRAVMESHVRQLERESDAIARVAAYAEDEGLRAYAWSRVAVVRQHLARARQIVWQLDLDDVR
jgi:predicted outer membrane protein